MSNQPNHPRAAGHQWLAANSIRSYPLEGAIQGLPPSLLLDASLCLRASPEERPRLSWASWGNGVVSVEISLSDGTPAATGIVPEPIDGRPVLMALRPIDGLCFGTVTVGSPGTSGSIPLEGVFFAARCWVNAGPPPVRLFVKGTPVEGVLSIPSFGDIFVEKGDQAGVIKFRLINQEGYLQRCEPPFLNPGCRGDVSPPVHTINGVGPDGSGQITIKFDPELFPDHWVPGEDFSVSQGEGDQMGLVSIKMPRQVVCPDLQPLAVPQIPPNPENVFIEESEEEIQEMIEE